MSSEVPALIDSFEMLNVGQAREQYVSHSPVGALDAGTSGMTRDENGRAVM